MQRLTREQWIKARMIATIVAVAAVVIAILVTDLATGGADKPKPENQVALGTGVVATPRPRTPLPTISPLSTDTPMPTVGPTTTAVPGAVAEVLDQTRKDDLEQIAAALEKYYDKKKEYPNSGGNLQTVCTYQEIDAGCKLKDYIDPIPGDPRGESGTNGYWYNSDGKSYMLIAEMDLPENATPQDCPESSVKHLKQEKTNLYCVSGSH